MIISGEKEKEREDNVKMGCVLLYSDRDRDSGAGVHGFHHQEYTTFYIACK